jgi:hypothetical protein
MHLYGFLAIMDGFQAENTLQIIAGLIQDRINPIVGMLKKT